MNKIRIVSDGRSKYAKIFTESGEDISNNVRSIHIDIDSSSFVTAKVEFVNVEFDTFATVVDEDALKENDVVYISVDGGEPFKPEMIGRCGIDFGAKEITQPGDFLRSHESFTHCVFIHYSFNNIETKAYYKSGEWSRMLDGEGILLRVCNPTIGKPDVTN